MTERNGHDSMDMPGPRAYTAEFIRSLNSIEAIRKRPGMYLGGTNARGLLAFALQPIEHGLGDVLEGYCHNIDVVFGCDGSLSVTDDARGLPMDLQREPESLNAYLTEMGAPVRGAVPSSAYLPDFWTGGEELVIANALSQWFEVEVRRSGGRWRQRFARGAAVSPLEYVGPTSSTGTRVVLKPDPEIFPCMELDQEGIARRLQELAFLNCEACFTVRDEGRGSNAVYHYKNGLTDFVRSLNSGREVLHEPFRFKGRFVRGEVAIALQYRESRSSDDTAPVISFANLAKMHGGGVHVAGFKAGLTLALSDWARRQGLIPQYDGDLEQRAVGLGLAAVISVLLREPQRVGPNLEKLVGRDVQNSVHSVVYLRVSEWLDEHSDVAARIVQQTLAGSRPPRD